MTNYVDIADVIVEEQRIRRHFDPAAITELADSIRSRGLIHAPVIRFNDDNKPVLVAGERRFRAISQLYAGGIHFNYNGAAVPLGRLPYTTLSDLSEHEVLAVELEENIIRRDISWQERIDAQRRLHQLRVAMNPQHTIADTAAIIYGDTPTPAETMHTKVNVLLAEHLDDPEISKAKNEREATQIARRKLESLFIGELASRTTVKDTSHSLMHGDCRELLNNITPGSVACMVTDPPYGINAHTFTKQSNAVDGVDHGYDDTFEMAQSIVHAIANADCMAADAHIWMFCDLRYFTNWVGVFEQAGWYVWPHPIIWDKQGVGALLGNANGPRHTYESILFAQRGKRTITKVFADVLRVRADTMKDHAAQKPVDLIRQLVELSCLPGETVLDPCCGSGTIFPAATLCKVSAIGIEFDSEQHARAKLRINATE